MDSGKEKVIFDTSKNISSLLCTLTLKQQRLVTVELVADDLADLPGPHHFPHLLHTGPLDTVSLTGQKDDFGQRCGPLDAVKIIVI